jgi:PRC-barrel domain
MAAPPPHEENSVAEPQPISWRTVVYGTPVISSDGERVGEVREMLGSDADDIFHGIRVGLSGARHDIMIPSDAVASLSTGEIRTSLTRADLAALPAFEESATYHLASVGWLRKHLGWKKDSEGDEEPG